MFIPGKHSFAGYFHEVYMYAVIKTGGKQYKVATGEKIKIAQIAADVGQEIVIDQVLAVGNGSELKVGTPLVSGATVSATVVLHGKHDKVRIFKLRRRKHYQKHQGHRQRFTELLVGAIAINEDVQEAVALVSFVPDLATKEENHGT